MDVDELYRDSINEIVKIDSRYAADAYLFVQHAVTFTRDKMSRLDGIELHITGKELLDGIRELAIQEYGPMAIDVLKEWGVTCTRDFGNIVFTMVEHSLLQARDEDSVEDFDAVFEFNVVFVKTFEPSDDHPPDDTLPKIV